MDLGSKITRGRSRSGCVATAVFLSVIATQANLASDPALARAFDWEHVEREMETLVHGTPDTKRAWVDGMAALAAWLPGERDPWVADRVADSISTVRGDFDEWRPLLEAALLHRAPSVRARAYAGAPLDSEGLPELLASHWSSEPTPWVRALGISRLAPVVPEVRARCREFADHEDVDLALAALGCLGSALPSAELVELLRPRLRSESPRMRDKTAELLESIDPFPEELRAAVVAELEAAWDDGVETRMQVRLMKLLAKLGADGVVERVEPLLDHPEDAVAIAAIETLARADRASAALLLPVARNGSGPRRLAAIDGLGLFFPDGSVSALREALATGGPQVRLAAIGAVVGGSFADELEARGIEARLEERRRLAEDCEAAWTPRGWLVREAMGRLQDGAIGDRTILYDRFDPAPAVRWAVGVVGETFRCHGAPEDEPDIDDTIRVRAGTVEAFSDHFDDGERVWLEFEVENAADNWWCWVRSEEVRTVVGSDATTISQARPAAREFDLAIEDLGIDSIAELQDRGVLETFDRGASLVGARFDARMDGDTAAFLRGLGSEWATSALGDAVRAALAEIVTDHGDHRGWDVWRHAERE